MCSFWRGSRLAVMLGRCTPTRRENRVRSCTFLGTPFVTDAPLPLRAPEATRVPVPWARTRTTSPRGSPSSRTQSGGTGRRSSARRGRMCPPSRTATTRATDRTWRCRCSSPPRGRTRRPMRRGSGDRSPPVSSRRNRWTSPPAPDGTGRSASGRTFADEPIATATAPNTLIRCSPPRPRTTTPRRSRRSSSPRSRRFGWRRRARTSSCARTCTRRAASDST